MFSTAEYEPSPWAPVAAQVARYEATGGVEGGELQGRPCVILTTVGRRTGKLRKSPLMRIEHEGSYAVVASLGGAPQHPLWYYNITAEPIVTLQDGPEVRTMRAHEATGKDKTIWWARAVKTWPAYDDYQHKTARVIPLLVLDASPGA